MKDNLPMKMMTLATALTFGLSMGQVLTKNATHFEPSNVKSTEVASSQKEGNCATQFVLSNDLENGIIIGGDVHQRVANDISVGNVGYSIYGVELNILTEGNSNLDFSFKILDGNSGLPWNVLNQRQGIVLNKEFVGTDTEGYDIYKYRVAFNTPLNLEANNRYWLEVLTNGVGWEIATNTALNAPLAYANDTTGGAWTFLYGAEGVFSLICEQPNLGTSNVNASDFSIYPNPVQDVLNFKSQKSIKSVEVYSISGQKVAQYDQPKESKVHLQSLRSGVYMLKVNLDGGEVKSLKINKK